MTPQHRIISPMRRPGLVWISLLGFILLLQGCQSFSPKAAPAPSEDCTLKMALDKSSYQPGEAARVTVELINNTSQTKRMQKLNARSVEFFFGRVGSPERMGRQAVSSKDEPMEEQTELAPGQTLKREFILTRLSEYGGALTAQAHYTPLAPGLPPKIYSSMVQFEVKGKRLFARDPEGLIHKKEAIGLAGTAARGEVRQAQAILITDEMGFLQWWVNVELKPAGSSTRVVSYFIDPYLGRVRAQANAPFDPKMAEDPRFARPANLPPMPMGAATTKSGK